MAADPTDRAIVELLRRYVQQRLAHGEIQSAIAADLGIDRAMVSKYKSGELPKSLKPATVRAFARLLGVDTGELERRALLEATQKPENLSPEFDAALTYLQRMYGRDFTQAAVAVSESCLHNAALLTINDIAARIYDYAQRERRGARGVALEDDAAAEQNSLRGDKLDN